MLTMSSIPSMPSMPSQTQSQSRSTLTNCPTCTRPLKPGSKIYIIQNVLNGNKLDICGGCLRYMIKSRKESRLSR